MAAITNNNAMIEALERREINLEIAVRCGLHTIRWDAGNETAIVDPSSNIVAFPYLEKGVAVAEKYRAPKKKFWQRKGGKKTFWNADALDDPALESGAMALIITEGEIDALSAMTAGFPLSVSVPDGAPPPRTTNEKQDEKIELEAEGKFEFLWNNRDRLHRIKRFIIAVDSDEPGKRLADELVRRLAAARCSFVEYPKGCKDLNDVLVEYGNEYVARLLNEAKPYPVHGLYRIGDYPDLPPLATHSTGWQILDQHLLLFPGEFVVVSGVPGQGKTVFTLNLMVNMAQTHGWSTVLFSAEMPVVPQLRERLRKIVGGAADHFINQHFVFIDNDPERKGNEDELSLDWLIERATDAVLRYGIRMFIIDPWNEIEHARDLRESVTDYIGRSIRALKSFAKRYQVVVVVVAHPTKDIQRDGKMRTPTLYDIEGSAHWSNKSDHGIIVQREGETDRAKIAVVKCRFDETGSRGTVTLKFERETWRFLQLAETPQFEEFK